jgi:hypothetical protein
MEQLTIYLSIRALSTTAIRARTLSGRAQISEGQNLVDGVPTPAYPVVRIIYNPRRHFQSLFLKINFGGYASNEGNKWREGIERITYRSRSLLNRLRVWFLDDSSNVRPRSVFCQCPIFSISSGSPTSSNP